MFFGGARRSTESGIPDFRSVDGLYPPEIQVSARDDALPYVLQRPTRPNFTIFTARSSSSTAAKPNAAHLRLAELEREGKCKAVVTQNIDGLHQAAGSKVRAMSCTALPCATIRTRCGKFYPVSFIESRQSATACPAARECGGIVKPDVVLYEEGLDEATMENADATAIVRGRYC